MTRRATIQSSLNPAAHHSNRRPYERIRTIVRAAESGKTFTEPRPPRRKTVNIGSIEKRTPKARAVTPVTPRTPGERIAYTLVNCDDPFDSQVPARDFTKRELATAQQAGTRWLKRTGRGDLSLSFRRNGQGAVWTLRQKPDTTTTKENIA